MSAAAAAAVFCALALTVACISAPPPELPRSPAHRPTILHEAVQPSATLPLSEWPADGLFLIPVEVDDPSQGFYWDVFVDYDYTSNGGLAYTPQRVNPTPDLIDGGLIVVSFTHAKPSSNSCHVIEFVVANSFIANAPHVPDGLGGDRVTWWYTGGVGTGGCPVYDAGALQDGAFSDGPMGSTP